MGKYERIRKTKIKYLLPKLSKSNKDFEAKEKAEEKSLKSMEGVYSDLKELDKIIHQSLNKQN